MILKDIGGIAMCNHSVLCPYRILSLTAIMGGICKTDADGDFPSRCRKGATVGRVPLSQGVPLSKADLPLGSLPSYLPAAILSAIAFRWRHCALVITLFS